MGKIKQFNANFTIPLPAASNEFPTISLPNNGERFHLRKIKFDYLCMNITDQVIIPFEANTIGMALLEINVFPAGQVLAKDFEPQIAPDPDITDRSVRIMKPGEYTFDQLFFINQLIITGRFSNLSGVKDLQYVVNIYMEVESIR
jgi:hypothetical protein